MASAAGAPQRHARLGRAQIAAVVGATALAGVGLGVALHLLALLFAALAVDAAI